MSETDHGSSCSQRASEAAGTPAVVARDASYVRRGYRSFEFATFEAACGCCSALLAHEHACERDLLLAIAGAVKPSAGSLVVAGEERARRRRVLACGRHLVGVGVVRGVLGQDLAQTVEEAVVHALRLARVDADPLEHLARFEIATFAAQRIERIPAAARARLSCALALAAPCDIAVVDLADPFVAGLSATDGVAVVQLLAALARKDGTAIIVGTTDPALARAADAAFALDIESAEVLGHQAAPSASAADHIVPSGGDDAR